MQAKSHGSSSGDRLIVLVDCEIRIARFRAIFIGVAPQPEPADGGVHGSDGGAGTTFVGCANAAIEIAMAGFFKGVGAAGGC